MDGTMTNFSFGYARRRGHVDTYSNPFRYRYALNNGKFEVIDFDKTLKRGSRVKISHINVMGLCIERCDDECCIMFKRSSSAEHRWILPTELEVIPSDCYINLVKEDFTSIYSKYQYLL